MKPYTELTTAGKLRRLHKLAEDALSHYNLEHPTLTYHAFETNLHYRVTSASGERFMLRLASPGWRTFADLQAEALWLEALKRETDIPVPCLLPARSGEYVLQLSRGDIPKIRNACLMHWVPGRLLGHYLNQPNLEKMGALFAALHIQAATWMPPAGFSIRRFEHWLSRDEENLLTPESSLMAQIPARERDLLERMNQHVEEAYAAIDRTDLRVIHCDLWHDNIRLHRGVLYPLDFEDTVWGFRAHDIAMAMLDLLESTDDSRYPVLLGAFRRGYQACLEWPADPIEPFQIGRLLWMINWVARFEAQHFEKTVAKHLPVFEEYLRSGRVVKPVGE